MDRRSRVKPADGPHSKLFSRLSGSDSRCQRGGLQQSELQHQLHNAPNFPEFPMACETTGVTIARIWPDDRCRCSRVKGSERLTTGTKCKQRQGVALVE